MIQDFEAKFSKLEDIRICTRGTYTENGFLIRGFKDLKTSNCIPHLKGLKHVVSEGK
jgi:hypothetical protein